MTSRSIPPTRKEITGMNARVIGMIETSSPDIMSITIRERVARAGSRRLVVVWVDGQGGVHASDEDKASAGLALIGRPESLVGVYTPAAARRDIHDDLVAMREAMALLPRRGRARDGAGVGRQPAQGRRAGAKWGQGSGPGVGGPCGAIGRVCVNLNRS